MNYLHDEYYLGLEAKWKKENQVTNSDLVEILQCPETRKIAYNGIRYQEKQSQDLIDQCAYACAYSPYIPEKYGGYIVWEIRNQFYLLPAKEWQRKADKNKDLIKRAIRPP